MLLLYLPSGFGRLTQRVTGYPYTHVALSLDDTYTHFYAFSRLRGKTPPISGYIEEKRSYYTLGEDVPIMAKIFAVPVTEEGYDRAVVYLEEVKRDPEIMYNLIHMLLIPIFGGRPLFFLETPRREYVGKTLYIIRELLYRQVCHRASKNFDPAKVRFVREA